MSFLSKRSLEWLWIIDSKGNQSSYCIAILVFDSGWGWVWRKIKSLFYSNVKEIKTCGADNNGTKRFYFFEGSKNTYDDVSDTTTADFVQVFIIKL